jgi:DNA-binding NtrC family response regulator
VASTLVALFGPKRGVRLALDRPTLVGRSSSATLQLIDGKVSREHCRFLVDDEGRLGIEDLGSQNGTFVNGEPVAGRRLLVAGDEIAVGDSLFLLDPDFAVLAARFGDATVVVAEGAVDGVAAQVEGAVAAPVVASDPAIAGTVGRIGALARALAAAPGAEEAVDALLTALDDGLHPVRAFVLAGAWSGAGAGAAASPARVLGGHGESRRAAGSSDAAPVIGRDLLDAAARRRAAVVASASTGERARGEGRSVVTRAARAVLVAPMLAGDVVTGYLYLDRAPQQPWSAGEIALAEAIAALAVLHGLGGAVAVPPSPSSSSLRPSDGPIGTSPAFERVRALAAAAARAPSTVLITGESGTGKEEIAREIHRGGGRGPFVAVNCGAIPEALAETELFGHERGAFTGAVAAREGRIESADGGTLFLDEIGDLAPSLQVKLLRVLQERVFFRVGSSTPRSVDLRVIAATHRRLENEIAAGRFREDLFYRLNVLRIEIPPLRQRREDVAPLATALLARIAARIGRADPGLAPAALETLARAPWPGNARELGNVLERALVLRAPGARGALSHDEIDGALGPPASEPPPDVPRVALSVGAPSPSAPPPGAVGDPVGDPHLPDKVAALERAEILAALRAARGVKARAAKQLGISRPTLDKKMTDLGIDLWNDDGGGGR